LLIAHRASLTVQRFFVPLWLDLTPGATVDLPLDVVHQAGHVLRLRPGDRVILLDGAGREAEVVLTTFSRKQIGGQVLDCRPAPPPPSPHVTLYQAVLKGDHFAWVLQKATELGVGAIVPVVTERTVVPFDEAAEVTKHARWERIVREAAEQSRRGTLPTLHAPLRWSDACRAMTRTEAVLLPWEEATTPLPAALAPIRAAAHVALAIGPEGGFSPAEMAVARAAGLTPVSLGPRILRAETAALACCALLLLPLSAD
jgi:16S rRNA (uracil1498-N3)-methyltransferase